MRCLQVGSGTVYSLQGKQGRVQITNSGYSVREYSILTHLAQLLQFGIGLQLPKSNLRLNVETEQSITNNNTNKHTMLYQNNNTGLVSNQPPNQSQVADTQIYYSFGLH